MNLNEIFDKFMELVDKYPNKTVTFSASSDGGWEIIVEDPIYINTTTHTAPRKEIEVINVQDK